MSSELSERFAEVNKIDQAIFEAESEVEAGARPLSLNTAKERLDKKLWLNTKEESLKGQMRLFGLFT